MTRERAGPGESTVTQERLTISEFIVLLDDHIEQHGGCSKWAASHGVSPGFVSHVRSGRRPVPEWVARTLGYKSIRLYEPTDAKA